MADDLIAAIATATGDAGIGIVRLSGPGAADVVGQLIRQTRTGDPLGRRGLPSHRLRHAYLVDPLNECLVDEIMVVRMAAPRSYTREEVVELHTHGGSVATRAALSLLLRHGARLAEPGEFTLRAFLNGRLDLSQAEAVAQVVSARAPAALALALDTAGGQLRRDLAPAHAALVRVLAGLEASIDFPEDDLPPVTPTGDLAAAEVALATLVARAGAGALFRDGLTVVLAGRPNVGKSSLMNALLRYERAIVTPVAGTTRDTLAESLTINGIPITLTDTAGLTDTDDVVERLGVARSRQALTQAGLTVLVLDGSTPLTAADRAVMAEAPPSQDAPSPAWPALPRSMIVALNKADRPSAVSEAEVRAVLGPVAIVRTAALTGDGVPALEAAIASAIAGGHTQAQADPALLSARQQATLALARDHVRAAAGALASGLPADIVAVDARAALERLGEITGESVTDTLLNEIFSQFCIGK
ncbi:MAG: tRNA uridine-5-carboxymethylaminomethyl(34) synthesis GTPase MnmE [Chloroflexi bacterium]|nr:tRNA uridine-5-carboxymethylaminomethyl(34) synthesis GTPase MnmE [Chloroflexota bacterium]